MRLSARPILNYANINSFSPGNQWIVRAGDPNTLYFQLVDLDQGPANIIGGVIPLFGPGASVLSGNLGLRYIPGIGVSNQPVSISVTFPSIDDTKVLTYPATLADPNDGSIWKVTIPALQSPNSGNVQFSVGEGTNIRRFSVLNLISVEFPLSGGSC
jgi:hypothetical protein